MSNIHILKEHLDLEQKIVDNEKKLLLEKYDDLKSMSDDKELNLKTTCKYDYILGKYNALAEKVETNLKVKLETVKEEKGTINNFGLFKYCSLCRVIHNYGEYCPQCGSDLEEKTLLSIQNEEIKKKTGEIIKEERVKETIKKRREKQLARRQNISNRNASIKNAVMYNGTSELISFSAMWYSLMFLILCISPCEMPSITLPILYAIISIISIFFISTKKLASIAYISDVILVILWLTRFAAYKYFYVYLSMFAICQLLRICCIENNTIWKT